MPDAMDYVQDRVLIETDAAIAHARRRASGKPECEECGAAITPQRQALGARLCIAHQRDAETRAQQARGRRC